MTTKRSTAFASAAVQRCRRGGTALAVLLAATFVAPSCQVSGESIDDHWNFASVPPRVARHVLGYDASKEPSYREFAWDRKQANSLTFRRYFLNHNPMNPNQRAVPELYEKRPVNSILPNPWNYVHFEGLILGWAATGGFFPLPIDSLLGTFERGGSDEFAEGISQGFASKGVVTTSDSRTFYGEDGEAPAFELTRQ